MINVFSNKGYNFYIVSGVNLGNYNVCRGPKDHAVVELYAQ